MPLPRETEILIVGAGPTGLALAAELRRRGLDPLLVDKQAEGANTSRAAVVHARTLEVLEPLGVVPKMLADGIKTTHIQMRDRDKTLAEVRFEGIPSPYPFVLLYGQDQTEATLLARLHELGGTVARPAELKSLALRPDGATAGIAFEDATQSVSARWIVACDGMHSTVREAAGIGFAGGEYEQGFALGDVHMDWSLPPDQMILFLSPGGLVLVAPLPGDHYRIVATADDAPQEPSAAYLQGILDTRGPIATPGRIRDVAWSSRFHVHHRVAATPRQGPVMLCGDAAHVHSPAGGQGMNTGIQDAIALANTLAEIRGGAPEARLDDWARSRHEIAQRVVAMTDRVTRLGTTTSSIGRLARNAMLGIVGHVPALGDAIARQMSEIDNR